MKWHGRAAAQSSSTAGWRACGAVLLLTAAVACAHPYPPTGGEPPAGAPVIESTAPAQLTVDPAWRGPVVFRFDRRLSERGFTNPVIVSPRTSEVRVVRGRSDVRVTLADGWAPGHIYRVLLQPGIRDLFGGTTTTPVEIVFSTGPPIPNTAVAGLVTDRLTGRASRNALVEMVRRADSVVYISPVDSAGFFALRHLPRGVYDVRAYVDVNRNRRHDAAEPVSPTEMLALGSDADTVAVLFAVLPPDTTPARLVRAEAVDSLQVRLHFDDHFEQDLALGGVGIRVRAMPDSTPWPAGRLLTPAQFAEREAARMAAQPPATVDTAAAELPDDPPGDRPDPGRARAAAARPARGAAAAQPVRAAAGIDPLTLPTRELIFVPDRPLAPGAEFMIEVHGVTNLHGIPGGGGEARFAVPARAEPAGEQ